MRDENNQSVEKKRKKEEKKRGRRPVMRGKTANERLLI